MDKRGTLVVQDDRIREILFQDPIDEGPAIRIDCSGTDAVLMPAFVDLHAHFRDPGFPEKETLESASLAAAAGGYGTVVCMANTKPVIDNLDLAQRLRRRCTELGLIDLYPVLSLTRGMEGRDPGHLDALERKALQDTVRLISEDGKDVTEDLVLLKALTAARRLDLPVSYHCDWGGQQAEEARRQFYQTTKKEIAEAIQSDTGQAELGRKILSYEEGIKQKIQSGQVPQAQISEAIEELHDIEQETRTLQSERIAKEELKPPTSVPEAISAD